MTTPAFIAGSYAYGTPTEKSDLDLVILADSTTLALLIAASDEPNINPNYPSVSLRFGKLNLLVCTEQSHYDVWQRGVEELRAKAPVTREEAIEHFERLWKFSR